MQTQFDERRVQAQIAESQGEADRPRRKQSEQTVATPRRSWPARAVSRNGGGGR